MFTNSTREVCLDILTLLDDLEEFPSETFNVILFSADLSVSIGLSSATGIIVDDDCKFVYRAAVHKMEMADPPGSVQKTSLTYIFTLSGHVLDSGVRYCCCLLSTT